MSVYRFFDSLSFKQKITLGFSALIIIMVTGMSYMLYQFTSVSKMTSEISDRYQPVTSTAGKALELAQASANLLHEHLLDYDAEKIEDHSQKMNQMKNNVMILIDYANTEALNINKDKLYRAIEIAEEIKGYSQRIEQLSYEYNENHPVITYATENLNPTGIEYLGYIAQILNEVDDLGLSIDEVILLSEMRQSWSQLMSHMRTIITTRNQTSMDNVYSYSEANLQQHNRLENMKPDLGLYNLAELKQLRERYISRLEYIREKLDAEVWRKTQE